MSDDTLQIPSFRVVFDLERRIHRIDRFRVPFPYGLPLRSLAYALVGVVAVLILRQLPAVGALLALLPIPAQLVLLPVGISCLLTRLRLDGRSAHAAVAAWVRHRLSAKELAAFAPVVQHHDLVLGDITFVEVERR